MSYDVQVVLPYDVRSYDVHGMKLVDMMYKLYCHVM